MTEPERTISNTSLGSRIQPLRASALMANVFGDGRLFWLKLSEWTILLIGVALCGFIALLIQ
jgi:hypothetical protein